MHERCGTGKGVIVALFDSGSSTHPELEGKYVYESKFDLGPNRVISPVDTRGHGTFLAGLIAARRDGEGIVGVAYEARIASVAIPVQHLTGGSQYASWRAGIEPQIDRMIELGALVTNNSWGTPLKDITPGLGLPLSTVRAVMPIDKYQDYVDAGGVQVWVTGNEQAPFPQLEAAAPLFLSRSGEGLAGRRRRGSGWRNPVLLQQFLRYSGRLVPRRPRGNRRAPLERQQTL